MCFSNISEKGLKIGVKTHVKCLPPLELLAEFEKVVVLQLSSFEIKVLFKSTAG